MIHACFLLRGEVEGPVLKAGTLEHGGKAGCLRLSETCRQLRSHLFLENAVGPPGMRAGEPDRAAATRGRAVCNTLNDYKSGGINIC